ncbi:MAG: mycothiol system anti-sigma-R factor [Actinomycetota bacterium]|nr:mycothiol system anti-sigma-R factor [Actinomycetota bacterium]
MDDDEAQPEQLVPRPDPGDLAAGIDCRESLSEVYRFLDGELTFERRQFVRLHLEGCRDCLEAYDFEAELRVVVSTSCKEKQLPPGLRERVADALRRLSGES